MEREPCAACGAVLVALDQYCPVCGAPVTRGGRHPETGARSAPGRLGAISRSSMAPRPLLAGAGAEIAGTRAPVKTGAGSNQATVPARPRRWYRRPLLVGPLLILLLVLAAAAVIAVRLRETISAVHAVSTPAPVVSGAALGGNASIKIDTGPARAAIKTAQAGQGRQTFAGPSGQGDQPARAAASIATPPPTPAPATGTASAPTATAAAVGTLLPPPQSAAAVASRPLTSAATAVPTAAPAATDGPSPSPTPALSQIERVKNGGFEAGNDGWYREGDAGAVATNAESGSHAMRLGTGGGYVDQQFFFVPGTTYRLTAAGKLGAPGDTAILGITYRNQAGKRLAALEPAVFQFTGMDYARQVMTFTVPDQVRSVRVYLWKKGGAAEFFADDLSIRSIIPVTTLSGPDTVASDHTMTILVMGVDARPGEAIDIGVRPDSLMVVRLNPTTGSCHLLAIPRDTRTELPGYGLTKINHALAVGGIPYEQQVVEGLLHLKIDHYVLIDFSGFRALVDAIGGVTIDVPESFVAADGTAFAPGQQQLTGDQALAYARYRGGPDGDFGRIARQQQLLRALVQKASRLNVVRSIDELLPAVQDHLRTDLSAREMASIGEAYRASCTGANMTMLRLDGYDATFDDPMLQLPLDYVVVDEDEIRRKVSQLKEP